MIRWLFDVVIVDLVVLSSDLDLPINIKTVT